jgi:3,4-dihydroxy 2-butanone 4-phosphate synthase / GTP cyclohydrolase II
VLVNKAGPRPMSRNLEMKASFRAGGSAPPIEELRDYGVGAQILTELGVHDMILLTNTHHSLVALEGYGLNIVREQPIG